MTSRKSFTKLCMHISRTAQVYKHTPTTYAMLSSNPEHLFKPHLLFPLLPAYTSSFYRHLLHHSPHFTSNTTQFIFLSIYIPFTLLTNPIIASYILSYIINITHITYIILDLTVNMINLLFIHNN